MGKWAQCLYLLQNGDKITAGRPVRDGEDTILHNFTCTSSYKCGATPQNLARSTCPRRSRGSNGVMFTDGLGTRQTDVLRMFVPFGHRLQTITEVPISACAAADGMRQKCWWLFVWAHRPIGSRVRCQATTTRPWDPPARATACVVCQHCLPGWVRCRVVASPGSITR